MNGGHFYQMLWSDRQDLLLSEQSSVCVWRGGGSKAKTIGQGTFRQLVSIPVSLCFISFLDNS